MNYLILSKFNIEEYQKYISLILIFLILCLSIFYLYLINSSVLNTVGREQNDKKISLMSSNIGILENDYMNIRASLNMDLAKILGFKDDFSKVHFSSENIGVAGNLSLLGDEI